MAAVPDVIGDPEHRCTNETVLLLEDFDDLAANLGNLIDGGVAFQSDILGRRIVIVVEVGW